MKLLTKSLPQNDLQKICLLLAGAVSVPVVKLFLLHAHSEAESIEPVSNAIPLIQIVTAIQPDNLPDFKPDGQQLGNVYEQGELQVIEVLRPAGIKDQLYQRMIVVPLQLTLPKGLLVEDSYDGLFFKSVDSHELPALKTLECPAVLCLADTQSGVFPESDLNSIQVLSGILEQLVSQWTQIQHEQQRLRKLKHDLRTPLTSMTMLPDIMKSVPGIDPESESMCEQLKIAARKLDRILTESVDSSYIDPNNI